MQPLEARPLEEGLAQARRKYRNWGRWGPDDVFGTLNFIDEVKRAQAVGLARHGRVFSLAVELHRDIPGGPVHTMLESSRDEHGFRDASDVVFMPLRAGTHWDGLGHVFDHDLGWNGRPREQVITSAGDVATGAERQATAFVSRGVLLDVGRAIGSGELDDGFAITEDHLRATISAQGTEVGRGDIVIVRTGQLTRCRHRGSWEGYAEGPAPGLSFGTLDWLHGTAIAAIASDTYGLEVRPGEFGEPRAWPLHQIAVPNMGLFVGEMFDADALARDCAADGVYEFLLIAAGLPIAGGVGAPVNPIAIK